MKNTVKKILTSPKKSASPLGLTVIVSALFLLLISCGSSDDKASSPTTDNTSIGSSNSSQVLNKQLNITEVSTNNNTILVTWNNINADYYRVIFGAIGERPKQAQASTPYYTITDIRPGQYEIIIEAYDASGNSIFSAPINREIF